MSLIFLASMFVCMIGLQVVLNRRHQARSVEPARPQPLAAPFAPYGTYLAPTHGWARFRSDGALKVGVDDLIAGALGKVDEVQLPPVGTRLEAGDPLATLRLGDGQVVLRAPFAGEVTARNASVGAAPTRITADPYGLGWLVALRPRDHKSALEPLHVGNGALAFLRREHTRLVDALTGAAAGSSAGVAVLADGAVIEHGAVRQLDVEALQRFEQAFLAPARDAD